VEPLEGEFAGVIIRLDGAEPHDKTPADDPAVNPLSPGFPDYDFYSLETVQRIGYDSFCPDNGVLLAKNKDKESRNGGPNGFNCFNWVIDAHPEDINKADYQRPDGSVVMRTIADYRQLNDALFHAGNDSGSQFEYVDVPNRLHFYIIDLKKNSEGILSYKIGVRSLDGTGPQKRGMKVTPPSTVKMKNSSQYYVYTVTNSGETSKTKALNNIDIYRLSVSIEGEGWNSKLLNSLNSIENGSSEKIPVYVSHDESCSASAKVTLTIRSENDPAISATSSFIIKKQ
jgi:hypothetical protein